MAKRKNHDRKPAEAKIENPPVISGEALDKPVETATEPEQFVVGKDDVGDMPPVDETDPAPAETVAAQVPEPPKAAEEKPAEKPKRVLRPQGLGHPEAKKLVNPQHTLEMKKDCAKKLGGKMIWTNKVWIIQMPQNEFTFPSRSLAALSLAAFQEAISQVKKKQEPRVEPEHTKEEMENMEEMASA